MTDSVTRLRSPQEAAAISNFVSAKLAGDAAMAAANAAAEAPFAELLSVAKAGPESYGVLMDAAARRPLTAEQQALLERIRYLARAHPLWGECVAWLRGGGAPEAYPLPSCVRRIYEQSGLISPVYKRKRIARYVPGRASGI